MPTVSVKWQKELFPAVEIDTDQPPLVFKCQLFDLTGVPPERQKIMLKGGLLKDDADWGKIGVKEGQKLMMMGTADVIPEAPKETPVFSEDLPEDMQGGALQVGYTAGLRNLGNTCYLNSTLQCLHSVPELKVALQKYAPSNNADSDASAHTLNLATRDIFEELDHSSYPVAPVRFLTVLRNKFPQFSQQDRTTGMYMQQDAEECWTQLVYNLSKGLRAPVENQGPSVATIKHLFGVDLNSTVKCAESEEHFSETETVYTMKCHISIGINHLVEGLKAGLVSEFEKNSPALGRSVLHVKESLISKLPMYMTVQFVRFFWKRESGKAKILRKVDYPLTLDVLEFCTDELKEKLKLPRKRSQEMQDELAGLKKDKGKEGLQDLTGVPSSSVSPASTEGKELQHTGIFDLVSVLTHKGRSADSGHYVAWVKQESGKWIEFDDENPIPQKEEDITKLSGGGDWHMAYICLYKSRQVAVETGSRSSETL